MCNVGFTLSKKIPQYQLNTSNSNGGKPTRWNNNFLFIDKSNLARHVSGNNFARLQDL